MSEYSTKPSTFYQVQGYPGLDGMASFIAEYIPKCKTYCEPFAGLGRVHNKVKADRIVLNDMSDYAFDFLSKNNTCEITKMQYADFIKIYDSENTFFLIDPPWRKNIYTNNQLPFCDRTPIQYYDDLLKNILPNVKADWILCVDRDEHEIGKRVSKSSYPNLVLEHPKKKLFNRKIAVRLASNKPFTRYNQTELMFN